MSHGRYVHAAVEQREAAARGQHLRDASRFEPKPCPGVADLPDWGAIVEALRAVVPDTGFALYLAALHPHGHNRAGALLLGAPPESARWITDRYGRILTHCADRAVRVVPCLALRDWHRPRA